MRLSWTSTAFTRWGSGHGYDPHSSSSPLQAYVRVCCLSSPLSSPVGNQNDSPPVVAAASTTVDASKTINQRSIWKQRLPTILERPLFSPGRDLPDTIPVQPLTETLEDVPPQLDGRLAGVMIRPGVREALFARSGQKAIAVKVGGSIDGWKIAAIEPDRVVLSSAFGMQTIKPTNAPEVVRTPARAINVGLMGPPTNSGTPAAVLPIATVRPCLHPLRRSAGQKMTTLPSDADAACMRPSV